MKLYSWGLLSFASFWMTCAGSWSMCCPRAPQGGCPFQRQEQQQEMGPDLGWGRAHQGPPGLSWDVFQNYFHLVVERKCDTQLCARAALALWKETCVHCSCWSVCSVWVSACLRKGFLTEGVLWPQNSSDPFPSPPWGDWLCCLKLARPDGCSSQQKLLHPCFCFFCIWNPPECRDSLLMSSGEK